VRIHFRRTPALALARRVVDAGRIGAVRHVRAQYLQDWPSDPDAPMTSRLDKARPGPGALGDLGAHLVEVNGTDGSLAFDLEENILLQSFDGTWWRHLASTTVL
jgi:hypothetical protein